ncbi:MAG TPA: hypothetical protein VF725_02595 [Ktedonobacterales bacterium]
MTSSDDHSGRRAQPAMASARRPPVRGATVVNLAIRANLTATGERAR